MPDPDLTHLLDQHRTALATLQRQTTSQTVSGYASAWQRLRQRLSTALQRPADSRTGLAPETARFLLQQAASELQRILQPALAALPDARQQARALARQHATQLLHATARHANSPTAFPVLPFPPNHRESLDRDEPERLARLLAAEAVGRLAALFADWQQDSPPEDVELAVVEARKRFGRALVSGLRLVRGQLQIEYRQTAATVWQVNASWLDGWIWNANLDGSCAACWMLSGSVHGLQDGLDGHPGCSCLAVPLPAGVVASELVEAGVSVFMRQPQEMQRRVLGAAKWRGWQAGQFEIEQVVGRRVDERWGSMRFERSLVGILAGRDQDRALVYA